MSRHVTLRSALDNDGAIPGVYKPDALDPAECGAQSTMLWEMALLPHHWHPAVRACAPRLTGVVASGRCPLGGQGAPTRMLFRFEELTEEIPAARRCVHALASTTHRPFQGGTQSRYARAPARCVTSGCDLTLPRTAALTLGVA